VFVCLSLCSPTYVCSLIGLTLEREGRLSPNFRGPQGWFYAQKFGKGVMGRGQKLAFFIILAGPAGHAPRQADWKLRWAYYTGGQCADAIERGIGVDWPIRILHTGTGSGGLQQAKAERGCLYVMPDWASRIAIHLCSAF